MKHLKNLFQFAVLNNKCYRRLSRFAIYNIIIVSSFILIFFSIIMGCYNVINNLSEENYDNKQIMIMQNWKNTAYGQKKVLTKEQLESISNNPMIKNICVSHYIEKGKKNNILLQLNNRSIDVLALNAVNGTYNTFDYAHIMEKQKEYGEFSVIVKGRGLKEEDRKSAIIDEAVVYALGYSDLSKVIGEKMIFSYGEIEETLTIVGVYNYKMGAAADWNPGDDKKEYFSQLSDELLTSSLYPIYVTEDIVMGNDILNGLTQTIVKVDTDSIKNVLSLYDSISSSVNNNILCNISEIKKMLDFIYHIFIIISIVLVFVLLVSFINLVNMLLGKVIQQRKNINLLIAVGYSKKDIKLISILDGLISLFKGIAGYSIIVFCSTLFLDRLFYKNYNQLQLSIAAPFMIDYKVYFLYTVVFIIVYLFIILGISSIGIKGKAPKIKM